MSSGPAWGHVFARPASACFIDWRLHHLAEWFCYDTFSPSYLFIRFWMICSCRIHHPSESQETQFHCLYTPNCTSGSNCQGVIFFSFGGIQDEQKLGGFCCWNRVRAGINRGHGGEKKEHLVAMAAAAAAGGSKLLSCKLTWQLCFATTGGKGINFTQLNTEFIIFKVTCTLAAAKLGLFELQWVFQHILL